MNPHDFCESSPAGLVPPPASYWALVPNPLAPAFSWTPELVTALSEADLAIGDLAGLVLSLPNAHLLIRPRLHREPGRSPTRLRTVHDHDGQVHTRKPNEHVHAGVACLLVAVGGRQGEHVQAVVQPAGGQGQF